MKTRYAIVTASLKSDADNLARAVAAYLPSNYRVVGPTEGGLLICGEDNAGWTLDAYVIPRLGSGMFACTEMESVNGMLATL